MKLHLLLLILGLVLSPIRAKEEEVGEGEGKDPPSKEMIEDESLLEEAPEENEKLEDLGDVAKKAKKATKKGGSTEEKNMRGWFWRERFSGYNVIFGSHRIQQSCSCSKPVINQEKWKKIPGYIKEELIIACIFDDEYKYSFKIKSDKEYIYYVQQKGGNWGDYKRIKLEDIDKYIGLSVIQWDQDGTPIFGFVKNGNKVIAFGDIKIMAYAINRIWGNYLMWAVHKKFGRKIKKYEVTWDGQKYHQFPEMDYDMLKYPYFFPKPQRKIVWIVVKNGDKVVTVPAPPDFMDTDIKWPEITEEWVFEMFPEKLYPPEIGRGSCKKNAFDECESEGSPDNSGDNGGGDSGTKEKDTRENDKPSGEIVDIETEEYSKEINGQSCSCRKSCECHELGPYKTLNTANNATVTTTTKKAEKTTQKTEKTMKKPAPATARKKRSNDVNGYQEFLKLTADCKTERRCRRAYTKFLNNGVIRIQE